MKKYLRLSLFMMVILQACSKNNSNNTTNPPTIVSFAPASAVAGTTVIIDGTNLNGTTAVSFGSTAAISFTVNSPTRIVAVVGGGSSGNISVTTPAGVASLPGFNYQNTITTYSSLGSGSFTVPAGINVIQVQLFGPGGWGGGGSGVGGNGGYVSGAISVTGGETINYFVGAGGAGSMGQTTYLKRGSTYLALAACGGNGSANGGHGGSAGPSGSGGTLGTATFLSGTAGSGATPSTGGAGGNSGTGTGANAGGVGSSLSGGTNNAPSTGEGWGGNGWFGGGASGTYNYTFSGGGPFASGGGGGGSNYTGGFGATIVNNASGALGGTGGSGGLAGKIIIAY